MPFFVKFVFFIYWDNHTTFPVFLLHHELHWLIFWMLNQPVLLLLTQFSHNMLFFFNIAGLYFQTFLKVECRWSYCFMVTQFLFEVMKKFWKQRVAVVAQQCKYKECHWSVHLKWIIGKFDVIHSLSQYWTKNIYNKCFTNLW